MVQLLLEQGPDIDAQGGFYGNAMQAPSLGGYNRAALQVAAEDNIVLDGVTYLPIPEETGDDSSGSGYEILSDDHEDFEIGDSTPPEYDSPLASLRDRISKPVEYFDRLKALAHSVYQHSTLQTYSKSYSPRVVIKEEGYSEPYPRYPKSLKKLTPEVPEPLPDSYVTRIYQKVGISNNAFASDLLEILECRNVNAHTYSNLRMLQSQGFCSQKFSMLTIDPYRHNVARLLPIDIPQILQLLGEIESVLRKIADFARHVLPSTLSSKVLFEQALKEQDDLLLFVPCCTTFLKTLGLVLATPSITRVHPSIPPVLRLVVSTIDLAVASYAGAHLERFEEYLGEDVAVIDVALPFASLHDPQIPLIKLSRCQLQCLDSFHNSQSV